MATNANAKKKPSPNPRNALKGLLVERRRKRLVLLPIAANVTTILRKHPDWAGVIAYDLFAEAVISTRRPPWDSADARPGQAKGPWTDGDTDRLANWLARNYGIHVAHPELESGLRVAAEANVVHPVRDYLRSLKWDKRPRLDSLVSRYFGGDDSPYTRGVGARWMISAVARVMQPGCQADYTLILESQIQGQRKSAGLRALVPVPTWYSETPINIGDKDSYQALRSAWIYCLDELDSVRRAETTRIKTFLTSTRDRYRPSYARRPQDFPRQNVFCGATNELEYLPDATGNRRYWPVRVGRASTEAIERDRDQLWAEAFVRYARGEKWWDNDAAFRALCEDEQATRVMPDGWEEPLRRWLEKNDSGAGVTTHAVLAGAFPDLRPEALNRSAEMRVGTVLRGLGYARVRVSAEGVLRWVYRMRDEAAREERARRFATKAGKIVPLRR